MAEWHPIWRPRASMAEKRAVMEGRHSGSRYSMENIAARQAQPRQGIGFGWYLLALLLPLAGGLAGIYWLAKGQVGPGLALWATSFIGFVLGLAILLG